MVYMSMGPQLILLNVVMLVSATSSQPNTQAIVSKRKCVLGSYIQIDSCKSLHQNQTSLNADEIINENEGILAVSEGTSCWADFTPGYSVEVVCQAGNWRTAGRNQVLNRQESPVLRSRRATFIINRWDSDEQTWVGQKANRPPTITCPSFDTNIYTEKGRTKATISWEVPTVNNTDNAIISVTQTQGQAPGTEHSAGTYTVSYIARDPKGQAAICSQTFTVIVRQCPHEFTYILNGMVTCTLEDKYIYGSECSYSCAPGYNLTGMTSLQCQSNGAWNGSKPQCKAITCASLENIEHGFLACETSQHTFMSKCEIVCDMGYAVSGQSDKVTCQANGQWTPLGECQVKQCPELENREIGVWDCSNNNKYGSVCSMMCAQHYALNVETSRICQENETWSGQPLECIKICPEPPVISHGYYLCGNGQQYQDTCILMCNKGYNVTGLHNITCGSNFQWTHSGACLDIEPPKPESEFPSDIEVIAQELGLPTFVNYSFPNFIDDSGEIVNVIGRPPSGSEFALGNSTITITASDKAGNNATVHFIVRVIARLCPDPSLALMPSDRLKFHCPNGFVLGAVCNASCTDGKQVNGTNSIKCHLNEWYSEPEWLNLNDTGPYCQERCSPGQWSSSGQQPCSVCEIGTYQANYSSTECEMCPYLMVTTVYGAVSKKDCKFVTYSFKWGLPRQSIKARDNNPSSFTTMLWVRVNNNSPRMTLLFTLNPNNLPQGAAYFSVDDFSVYVVPTQNSTAKSIRYWYHVGLVFERQDGSGTLYVNGKVVERVTGLSPRPLSYLSLIYGATDAVNYFFTSPLFLSGFQLTPTALTQVEMSELYNSCLKQMDDNILAASPINSGNPIILPTQLTVCDEIDDCEGNPCGDHATCFDQGDTFTCECSDQWSGKTCQLPPNFCLNHNCANGATCISNIETNNFTCICSDGYKGSLCKDIIVNGGWGMWGEWSSCSILCGSGQRSRMRSCDNPKPDSIGESCHGDQVQQQKCYGDQCPVNGIYGPWSDWSLCSISCGVVETNKKRVCDNPAPSNGGLPCEGLALASILCNQVKCPECSELKPRSGHQSLDCRKDVDNIMTSCQIICKPGLTIMPQVINRFQCGFLTNYVWSHLTENNPTGILPDCAKLTRPANTTLVIKHVYDTAKGSSAQAASNVTDGIQNNLLSALNCNISSCSYQVTVTATCEGVNPVTGKLRIEIIPNASTITGEDGHSLMESSQKIDIIFNNLINTSANILKSCAMGPDYTGHVEAGNLVLQCPDGTGYSGSVCVDCPPGSYSPGNGSCILCGKNSYQDQARMTSCKACFDCSSTSGEGSFSSEQCQSTDCGPSPSNEPGDAPLPLIIGLAVGLGSFFIVATVVVIIIQRRCRKQGLEHPYDIPGERGLKDEDPYANGDIDETYDEIEESPYISAQGISAGSIDLNSDGCVIAKDHYDTSNYIELKNTGFSNGSRDQIVGNYEAKLIGNVDNDLITNPESKLSTSDVINKDNYEISKAKNDYHEIDQNQRKKPQIYPDNAHDVTSIEKQENVPCVLEVQPQQQDFHCDDSSALDASHISNTHRDPDVQAVIIKDGNPLETRDVKICYDSGINPDKINN